jgi:hypothetical protein
MACNFQHICKKLNFHKGMKSTETLSDIHTCCIVEFLSCVKHTRTHTHTHTHTHIYIYIYIYIYTMKSVKSKCCSLRYTYRRNCSPTTKMKLTATQEDRWPTINSKCKTVPQLQPTWTSLVGTKWSSHTGLVLAAAQAIMWLATLLTPVVRGRKHLPLNPINGTIHHK